jgi:hypothetical protein
MTTRLALILTGVWTLVVVAGCAAVLWYVMANAPRSTAEARLGQAGTGCGTVAALGYGAIWLPWAAAWGKRRRERLERERAEEEEDERPRKRKKARRDG